MTRERRQNRRGPVTTMRIVAGAVAVLAPFVLGLLGHSPWKALLLLPAFVLSYALGRASAWRELLRDGSAATIAGAAFATCAVQLALAATLYLAGLALGVLFADILPFAPLSSTDFVFVAIVWVVTLGCALTSARLERRRSAAVPGGVIEG